DVLAPAREVLVDRFRVVEVRLVHGYVIEAFAVDVIGDAHRDLLETGEDVELGEHQIGDAVHARGVAGDGRVVPADAARPTRGGAELEALLAQPVALLVEQLGRERARADAGGVRLDDADDAVQRPRPDARSGRGPTGGRRRRGDERVRAV